PGPERKLGEVSLRTQLTWSPEGDSLIVVEGSDSGPDEPFLLSVESGERRRLTSLPALTRDARSITFSPDGRTIAFVRAVDDGVDDLYLLPVGQRLRAVGEPQRLTLGGRPAHYLAWAPEGREIVFSSGFLG